MRLLLDTNALLWWEGGSEWLGPAARVAIRSSDLVYVSAVSAWEMEIKRALGKLRFTGDVGEMIAANGFVELPVTVQHAATMGSLAEHPRDPFDRMLIAQALAEDCTLVTGDRGLARYAVPMIDARA